MTLGKEQNGLALDFVAEVIKAQFSRVVGNS